MASQKTSDYSVIYQRGSQSFKKKFKNHIEGLEFFVRDPEILPFLGGESGLPWLDADLGNSGILTLGNSVGEWDVLLALRICVIRTLMH